MSTNDNHAEKKNVQARVKLSRKKLLVRFAIAAVFLLLAVTIAVVSMQVFIGTSTKGKTYDHFSDIPEPRVGLVFGCDDKFQGRDNLYFRYRIDAATALWNAGKLRCLIVSGDNSSHDYNEPEKMKNALVARGVPVRKIVCDYAGLRTLDSVVRCKKVFGCSHVIVISQEFQNERAIVIGEAEGMNVIGLNAKDVIGSGGTKTKIREWGARVKMCLDIFVLHTQPRHLGAPITLPL